MIVAQGALGMCSVDREGPLHQENKELSKTDP